MRQWLEAGYFKGDLPINQNPSGPFHQLCIWFPDLNSAFRLQEGQGDTSKDTEELLRKEAEAAERNRLAEEAEAQNIAAALAAQKEAEEMAAARELERLELEKAQTTANGGNQSSTQLKMMLGLSSAEQPVADNQIVEDVDAAKRAAKNQRSSEKKPSKAASKKSSHKTADKSQVAPQTETSVEPLSSEPVQAAPAWGGAKTNKPRKSMSEIQQEEARTAAILAAKRGSTGQSGSSGWANVAARSAGSSSATVRPSFTQNAAPVTSARPVQASSKPQHQSNNGQGGASRKVATNIQNHRAAPAPSSTPAEEFGTSMSPVLEKWCKEKMQQINGSDDLTLVAFCMTLNDANEIRQYLTTYLGLTPQVNNFATEFINKRGLGSKQEEWETPASAKKVRKKKSGR